MSPSTVPLKVLLHVPEETALPRARANARNLLAAAPGTEVEIVVNAGAVAAALAQPDPGTDALLRLCANSLRGAGLSAPADLVVVPAAVLHLAQRQSEGWSYIRA
ncbi:hypothetical protein KM176_14240 [Pseudooceanicola sp. CBS1P-1]|uniref:Intracellular sulfur oxidation protein, DsrE/DsrF family n=1 Tax=Pseudooceanicola albus TaxID=2692189 RepID=A0A6L7G257_9RHOB|nr:MULTISPECIES: hypothetical protein [Pseudooceanicola]MBT9385027.1 hypothetical protein [Pseudooceanicola endophyticus]MXN17979.1 hypothetical protein [Pseudooceanicola albus]